jgi:hypothetical protein
MNVQILLIIFFLFIIINHLLNHIIFPNIEQFVESMECNPNKKSKNSVCFKKKMSDNKSMIIELQSTMKDLMEKATKLVSSNKGHNSKITQTTKNITKLKNSEEGRGVDNSDACKKHPEAC